MSLEQEINRILDLIGGISPVLTALISVMVLLIFLYFFLGTTQYVYKEEGLEEVKKKILWGIIGIFAVMSVWGLIHLLQSSLFGSYNSKNVVDIETITF